MFQFSVLYVVLAAAAGQAPGRDQEPKKYALLASINDYEHDALGKLECAEDDGKALADLLKQSGYEVDLLLGRQATKKAIEEKLNAFAGRGNRRGVVLIGFFGHGVQPADKSYFVPFDARPKVLKDGKGELLPDGEGKLQYEADPATLVPLNLALAALAISPAGNRVLLADCCRNDPSAARGRDAGFGSNLTVNNLPANCAVVLGCEKGQRAFENRKEWGHGAFTKGLLDELGSLRRAGRPATLGALVDAVPPRVESMVKRQLGLDQTPRAIYTGRADLQLTMGGIIARPENRPEPPPFPFTAQEAHEYVVKCSLWQSSPFFDTLKLGVANVEQRDADGPILEVRIPKVFGSYENATSGVAVTKTKMVNGIVMRYVEDVPVAKTYSLTVADGWETRKLRLLNSGIKVYDTSGVVISADKLPALIPEDTPVLVSDCRPDDPLDLPARSYIKYVVRIPSRSGESNREPRKPAPVPSESPKN